MPRSLSADHDDTGQGQAEVLRPRWRPAPAIPGLVLQPAAGGGHVWVCGRWMCRVEDVSRVGRSPAQAAQGAWSKNQGMYLAKCPRTRHTQRCLARAACPAARVGGSCPPSIAQHHVRAQEQGGGELRHQQGQRGAVQAQCQAHDEEPVGEGGGTGDGRSTGAHIALWWRLGGGGGRRGWRTGRVA